MPDIEFDVFPADGGLLVNGVAGSSANFQLALANNSTIELTSANLQTMVITDDEEMDGGNLDGDSPNEQAPAGSAQTTDILGQGQEPVYVDFQYTVEANGQQFTLYVIDVRNSPDALVVNNIAVTFIAFDNNNPPPFDTPLTIVGFAQTASLPYQELICFCPGARIATPFGEAPVESLIVGDFVQTRDHGPQPIRLIARRRLSRMELALKPHLKPVVIRAGALGDGLPRREIRVSPQHRFLLSNAQCVKLFGDADLLVSAKTLLDTRGVRVAHGARTAEYIHLVFGQHEIIYADGAPTESLYPGERAVDGMDSDAREELFEIFPELRYFRWSGQPAAPIAKQFEGAVAAAETLARRSNRRRAPRRRPLIMSRRRARASA